MVTIRCLGAHARGAVRVFIRGNVMHRPVLAVCATAIGVTLSAGYAVAPLAPAAAAARHRSTIVVAPGQSIQAAVDRAGPGGTVLVKAGVYRQSVLVRTGITLRGAGSGPRGTVLLPPRRRRRHDFCDARFGQTGICILARTLDPRTGAVLRPVRNVSVTGFFIAGFAGNGVLGYGTSGLVVRHVTAVRDGDYGIARFRSTRTLLAGDTAIGNAEAGFYIGDSPNADTVVAGDRAMGNEFGVFIRHARRVGVDKNLLAGNCQGVFVLDDGQPGGAGTATIRDNIVRANDKFCPKRGRSPVPFQGGGILLVGATKVGVVRNLVVGNRGRLLNSGGIVVASARALTHGSAPHDIVIARNRLVGNAPDDLIWDRSGTAIDFVANRCRTSSPPGLCH